MDPAGVDLIQDFMWIKLESAFFVGRVTQSRFIGMDRGEFRFQLQNLQYPKDFVG